MSRIKRISSFHPNLFERSLRNPLPTSGIVRPLFGHFLSTFVAFWTNERTKKKNKRKCAVLMAAILTFLCTRDVVLFFSRSFHSQKPLSLSGREWTGWNNNNITNSKQKTKKESAKAIKVWSGRIPHDGGAATFRDRKEEGEREREKKTKEKMSI